MAIRFNAGADYLNLGQAPNYNAAYTVMAWVKPASLAAWGEFWADQFGRIVAGPTALSCGAQQVVGEKSYTIVCARQFIAPTLRAIQFPGNAVQRQFPGGGQVVLPN